MTEEQEDLPEFDYTDPLKRAEDGESMPGLDPVITIPPDN